METFLSSKGDNALRGAFLCVGLGVHVQVQHSFGLGVEFVVTSTKREVARDSNHRRHQWRASALPSEPRWFPMEISSFRLLLSGLPLQTTMALLAFCFKLVMLLVPRSLARGSLPARASLHLQRHRWGSPRSVTRDEQNPLPSAKCKQCYTATREAHTIFF